MRNLAEALKQNDVLLYLSLAYSNLTEKSVPFLLDIIEHNSTIIMIDLLGNNIPFMDL